MEPGKTALPLGERIWANPNRGQSKQARIFEYDAPGLVSKFFSLFLEWRMAAPLAPASVGDAMSLRRCHINIY